MFTAKIASGNPRWASLLAMGMSFSMVITLIAVQSALGDSQADCNSPDDGKPGCWKPVPVPCSKVTCADWSTWPENVQPVCSDFTKTQTNYSTTIQNNWSNCFGVDGLPKCFETWAPCAYVTTYWGNTCDRDHSCADLTINHCEQWRSNACKPNP